MVRNELVDIGAGELRHAPARCQREVEGAAHAAGRPPLGRKAEGFNQEVVLPA